MHFFCFVTVSKKHCVEFQYLLFAVRTMYEANPFILAYIFLINSKINVLQLLFSTKTIFQILHLIVIMLLFGVVYRGFYF
jgi:hypothetical protein